MKEEISFFYRVQTMTFFGFLKKLALFVVIVAIAIPVRYGSTNPIYILLHVLHSGLPNRIFGNQEILLSN
jgi:hypothetical protein